MNKSFTLIELLVVVAIIGILASIVLVSLQGAKDQAKLAETQSFARQIRSSLGLSLMSEWRFENNTNDSSGYENSGTIVGAPAYVAGMFGQALEFDGTDDFVSTQFNPNNEIGDLNAFTVSSWIRPRDSVSNQEAIGSWYVDDKRFYFGIKDGDYYWGLGSIFDVTTQTVPVLHKWQHLVWVYEGGSNNMLLYLDGENTYSEAYSGNGDMPDVGIPLGGGTQNFNGALDEVRIYNQALSLAEIQQLYAQGAVKYTKQ